MVPSHSKEEDRCEFFSFQFDPDDLENLHREDMMLFVFQDQSGFLGLLDFLFMSSSSGDGSSVSGMPATIVSGRVGTLSTLLCCLIINTLLHSQCDMLLLRRVFNDHIHRNGLFICQTHYWISAFVRIEGWQTKEPGPGCQEILQGLSRSPHLRITPCSYKVAIEGLSGEWILTGQWLSEDCFLVFPSRS